MTHVVDPHIDDSKKSPCSRREGGEMVPLNPDHVARRDFLRVGVLTAAGLGLVARPARAEPPPEIRTLKLSKEPYACIAPQYIVDEFLAAEGFSGVERVEVGDSSAATLV